MSFTSVPWDGEENDMYEHDWRAYHRAFGDGLIKVGTIITSENDREFSISGLEGVLQGAYFLQSGTDSIMVPPPSSGQRYSHVSLKYDPGANTISLSVRHGGGGSNPIPPTPVQEENGVWEMPIYEFGPAGDGSLDAIPGRSLRLRMPRLYYAPNDVHRRELARYARHSDLAFDDEWVWYRWNDSRWVPTSPVGDTEGWIAAATGSSWTGSYYYARRGGIGFVRGRVSRISSFSGESVVFDLPSTMLPSLGVDTHAWQNLTAGRRYHALVIETSGRATVYPGADGQIVGQVALRFETSWPLY